ncbi:MAG: ABC transporter ATP-binding protein [Clostridiales bacterium]|nr:ABC transporter ATP-binding protein [Clostridiales bacterium]
MVNNFAFQVANVNKNYTLGKELLEILKDVSFNVRSGEFVSIMGPSGSGKSTLLYLMGGLDKPTSGQILVNGKELSAMTDKEGSILRRRDIGFVFQFYNLIPNLTVEENILLPVMLDGKNSRRYQQTLEEVMNDVDIYNRRRHTPRELSGGQQQRVAIARALMNSPDIILADEPTGNLDTKTGAEIMALLAAINAAKKKTIVQVTHSKDAAQCGNRIINVIDGRVSEYV